MSVIEELPQKFQETPTVLPGLRTRLDVSEIPEGRLRRSLLLWREHSQATANHHEVHQQPRLLDPALCTL
jgi:hypothetical protein